MNINAIWERMTALSLKHRGVQSTWVEVDGMKIHSLLSCSSLQPAFDHRLVCVHGLGSSGSSYGLLLPELSQFWSEIWAPSAPSHGMSPPHPHPERALDLTPSRLSGSSVKQNQIYAAWEKLLLHLSISEPITLVGISLGGAISLRFAARYPERVHHLILCSPAGARLDQEGINHLKRVFRMSEAQDGLRFLKTLYHKAPWWSPLLAPLVRKSLSRPEAQSLITQLRPGDGLSPEEIRNLKPPCLLIWGKRERVLPLSSLEFFSQNAPKNMTILQPESFSHAPHREHIIELSQLILDWVNTLSSTVPLGDK